ncbi:hypothetical protein SYNPS1DRAFT_13406 [Syncephalis pseudoplumigaleata]|uniref:Dilute domain-containing protein n=1 Tax=Syncephalis pseudoplumigaleata TaxID=1712513 RepID=A0A4P9Z515_9FUNG|nr:hypothetical protein SYNPS1DRAFT_13406 [Syncephalis pseudoplumigaleata]|eukprot:RKP26951.1 hypothetical protein SYNPS1DRAFT_13406 [Syncephalis pseudoplumigaleata]
MADEEIASPTANTFEIKPIDYSTPGVVDPDQFASEEDILADKSMSDEMRHARMSRLLSRAASNGDDKRVCELLENPDARAWIDPDAQDEDGTTPLIYAACFGYIDVAKALLRAGAKVDAQDRFGWSALMWATNNNHERIVKLLLDNGASTNKRSATGRTAFTSPRGGNGLCASSPTAYNWREDNAYYTHGESTPIGFDPEMSVMETEAALKRALANASELNMDLDSLGFDDEEEDDDMPLEFNWDTCLPTQMLVFPPDGAQKLIDILVRDMKPLCSREKRATPANVLFLAARYANNFGMDDALDELLGGALDCIGELTQARSNEVPFLAFWLSNCTQLLYYLRKDASLVGVTVSYQCRLSELIQEAYILLVRDVQARLSAVLHSAILLHDPIPLEDLKFERESRRSFLSSMNRRISFRRSFTPQASVTPRSVTALLSSSLFVLQTYEVHPSLIHQATTQLLYYINSELFNGILTDRALCSRSKAMQIRMNLSELEAWVRSNHLPTSLLTRLSPVTQLLQFLQCLSQLRDVEGYVETVKALDQLNALQLMRAVRMYRYEIGETRVTGDVRRYIEAVSDATAQQALPAGDQPTTDDADLCTVNSVRSVRDLDCDARGENAGDPNDVQELVDSAHMLPFSVPSNNEMNVSWGKNSGGKDFTPTVPDDFFSLLDGPKRT